MTRRTRPATSASPAATPSRVPAGATDRVPAARRTAERAAKAAPWAALAYAALQTWWLVAGAPHWTLAGSDLVLPPAAVIAACLAAAALTALRRPRWSLVIATWATSLLLAGAAAVLLLDLVGHLLPGLGIPQDNAGLASRLACLTVAATTAAGALTRQRHLRGCPRCSRVPRLDHTPRWAYAAAYAAVAGFALRIYAQLALFGPVPFDAGPQSVIFEGGFALAGVLLPLALVHSWGKTWPGTARRIPRWLVAGPGFAVAGALLVYFGAGLVQLAGETLAGTAQQPVFMWTAMSAYTVWGAGLAVATVAYYRITRPACPRCGL